MSFTTQASDAEFVVQFVDEKVIHIISHFVYATSLRNICFSRLYGDVDSNPLTSITQQMITSIYVIKKAKVFLRHRTWFIHFQSGHDVELNKLVEC